MITYRPATLMMLITVVCLSLTFSSHAADADKDSIKQGKQLALKFCQACHQYQGTDQAGTVAPPGWPDDRADG